MACKRVCCVRKPALVTFEDGARDLDGLRQAALVTPLAEVAEVGAARVHRVAGEAMHGDPFEVLRDGGFQRIERLHRRGPLIASAGVRLVLDHSSPSGSTITVGFSP